MSGESHKDTVFIRGLNPLTREKEIRKELSKYGEIVKCDLILDPITEISKCFAFVTMSSAAEAQEAIKELDGSDFDGKKIRAEIAKCGVREGAKTESSSGIVPTGGPRRGPPTLPRDRQPLPYPRRDPYLLPRLQPYPLDPRGMPVPSPLLPHMAPPLRGPPYYDPVPHYPKVPKPTVMRTNVPVLPVVAAQRDASPPRPKPEPYRHERPKNDSRMSGRPSDYQSSKMTVDHYSTGGSRKSIDHYKPSSNDYERKDERHSNQKSDSHRAGDKSSYYDEKPASKSSSSSSSSRHDDYKSSSKSSNSEYKSSKRSSSPSSEYKSSSKPSGDSYSKSYSSDRNSHTESSKSRHDSPDSYSSRSSESYRSSRDYDSRKSDHERDKYSHRY